LQVKIAEKIRGKGSQVPGRLGQPLQHRVGSDFEDPSSGTDTQALSQASQDPHDEFDRGLFAVEERAMRLQKVALTCRAVELAPGAPTRMPVRAQIAKPAPALIVTMAVRTEVHGGIDLTGPPVRRCHRGGR